MRARFWPDWDDCITHGGATIATVQHGVTLKYDNSRGVTNGSRTTVMV